MTILVISPHLDDAILSIGGSIAAWARAGQRVVIATVYTTGPALSEVAPRMRKFADYATRRAEDAAACAAVGAEPRWLDQVERAFREPYLTGLRYFTTPPDRAGLATLAQVTRALEPLGELAPDAILLPLGVGNHVDHVETAVAATDWAIAHRLLGRVRFYEDFYALSTALRKRHFVTRHRLYPRLRPPLFHARRLTLVMRAIAAAGRGPGIDQLVAPALRAARWTVEPSDIRAAEPAKLAAIACYGSQTAAFGGLPGIARAIRAQHACWGGAELLWRAV